MPDAAACLRGCDIALRAMCLCDRFFSERLCWCRGNGVFATTREMPRTATGAMWSRYRTVSRCYAAIIREISAKGDAARFKKHERGVFVAGQTA